MQRHECHAFGPYTESCVDQSAAVDARGLRLTSWTAACWAFLYGLYRFYYAVGGEIGIPGTPASQRQWLFINGAASMLLFAAAGAPIVLRSLWYMPRGRMILLALCWVITVTCVGHALIGMVQRISSLTGSLTISYPFWQSIDRRQADLQALFFNEPWFLGEGLLWSGMAWAGAMRRSPRRWIWYGSAAAAVAVYTTIGLLSAFGIIGRVVVG